MDGWQAVQNWAVFGVVVSGLAYYYYPRERTAPKPAPPSKEPKKDVKKVQRKPDHDKATAPSRPVDTPEQQNQNGNKKRKANTQPASQTPAISTMVQDNDREDFDMTTRQFAASMQKAREGIQVKSSNNNDTRVKTVKPKNSPATSPILSSGSSQADAEDDWSPAASPAVKASGIDDMLEALAPGPTALRITASDKPTREKVKSTKEVVETKKQRQNRRKAEENRLAREADEQERKVLAERQRRTAREARGEPAKNGIPTAAAPAANPWAQRNTARDAHLPAVDNTGNNVQLLDTLDTESNSSSNQGASTAATSVVADAAPSRWREDDDFAKALEESERDSGWNEVKSNKKNKKNSQVESNGNSTPVPTPPANKKANNSKPIGFQTLSDETEQMEDVASNDPSSWAA